MREVCLVGRYFVAVLDRLPQGQLHRPRVEGRRGLRRRRQLRLNVDRDVALRRNEIEVADHRAFLPGRLLAAGLLMHAHADPLEGVLQLQARLLDHRGQGRGVGTVRPHAVGRQLPGRRRIGDVGPGRRIHLGQTPARRAKRPLVGIVPAGIQDHYIQAVAGNVHLGQHPLGADRLDIQIALALDRGIERYQVVHPARLDRVAGVVEQADPVLAGRVEPNAEVYDGALHRALVGVLRLDHLEAHRAQGLGHQGGVVLGIGERRDQHVVGVPYHQRHARLGPRGR